MTDLPIDAVLPEVLAAVAHHRGAVIEAPPGAGKTTRVPPALLGAVPGRIVMLEPRRLAARGAAHRMAETLGEPVGATVGYRMRGETRVSAGTRIEVVTEGVLTRMLQGAPDLPGIGAVIFDEIHERSLNADLGLALCLEVRGALRPDLVLIAMSATLDGAAVAEMLEVPRVRSEGRAFPVETVWLDRPAAPGRDADVAGAVLRAWDETRGGILAFLPGEREIRAAERALRGALPGSARLHALYGALPFAAQRRAVAPEADGRKVVLATSIAETSLTIADIRAVVDAGLARRARFDPGTGMARLVTERASQAEADQRRGRAGRVAPGRCYRLWSRAEEGAMAAQAPPEILSADLAGLALELAAWGVRDPAALRFLTPPPEGPFAAARRLLEDLGALAGGAITAHGHAMAALPLHPRLAHMAVTAGRAAAPLAALLSERDPLPEAGVDLAQRLASPDPRAGEIARAARRLGRGLPDRADAALSPAQMAALAYPDRIGLRRPGDPPRWLLSGGPGVRMDPDAGLAGARLIVVTDTDGAPRDARIRRAIALPEADLRAVASDRIAWERTCAWDRRAGRVAARLRERLGALVLEDRAWPDPPPEAMAAAMLDGARALGLPWSAPARRFAARVALAGGLPAMDEPALLRDAEAWLLPYLGGITGAEAWRRFDLLPALEARLTRDERLRLDREVPAAFVTPLGRRIPVDYDGDTPAIALRLQEMFGVTRHPTAGGRPIRVTLLSPAGRPLQVTADLPGFWATSYAEVRRDMRGRYPRHPWPEDPTVADPTLRARRRGGPSA